jgi:hypothetical protein
MENDLDVEVAHQAYTQMLKNNVLQVTFNKKSTGELRTMRCTLNNQYLPEQTQTVIRAKEFNPEVVSVFDLDKQDWRSFRIDSVVEVAVEEAVNG